MRLDRQRQNAEPEDLLELIDSLLAKQTTLAGKKILVTAGPTREALDPVRYFSNYSSGKMGYAIAKEARKRGAYVTLVSGPTALDAPAGVEVVEIQSAEEMYHAVTNRFSDVDIVVKSAAVADYQPEEVLSQKRKKQGNEWSVPLVKTKDTLLEIGKRKDKQILVGFAAESEQLDMYAKEKLKRKNLDLIVANNITEKGAGFDVDTNVVSVFTKDNHAIDYPEQSKAEVASVILDELEAYMKRRELL